MHQTRVQVTSIYFKQFIKNDPHESVHNRTDIKVYGLLFSVGTISYFNELKKICM